ncbi:MAG: alpha/beta hydrolase [Jatrophihabitans sp.]
MSLMGTPLLILLAVLAMAFPVGAVLYWHRIPGPRPVRTGTRAGLLVASQLTAVLLVAAALNDYGAFYSSWGSLLNRRLHNVHITASIGHRDGEPTRRVDPAPATAGRITLQVDPPYAGRAQWATRGRLQSVIISGASSGLHEHAFVYLPPQYFQPKYARTRFPALEVMSGYPGSERDLITGMNYPTLLTSLILQHRVRPTVLVLLLPSVTYPHDTECTNVPAGPQAETFYAGDIPSQVAHDYRVLATGWGAIGGSTGGYCAAKFAMLHPRVFHAAVSIQGYYVALKDHTTGDLWGGSSVLRNLNDLEWRLRTMPAPPVSIMVVSTLDQRGPYGHLDTERFASLVKAPMAVQTVMYPHGGHNIATWRIGLSDELAWLSARLPGPVPVG